MATYYELHREEILRKQRERRLKKMAELPPDDSKDIEKLQRKIKQLEDKVDYYKNLAEKYRQQRMEANAKLKEAKSNAKHLSEFKKLQIQEQITKLEKLIETDGSSRRLNTLRREKIEELNGRLRN